jgi:hypothetical protein
VALRPGCNRALGNSVERPTSPNFFKNIATWIAKCLTRLWRSAASSILTQSRITIFALTRSKGSYLALSWPGALRSITPFRVRFRDIQRAHDRLARFTSQKDNAESATKTIPKGMPRHPARTIMNPANTRKQNPAKVIVNITNSLVNLGLRLVSRLQSQSPGVSVQSEGAISGSSTSDAP